MSRLDEVVAKYPQAGWRLPAVAIMLLLAAALGWSAFARLDEVAISDGEVVPLGQVKVIQHLEGGIVEEILVTEGAAVEAGQPLVRLNLATVGLNRGELLVRLDALQLRRARLLAEATGEVPSYPVAEATRRPRLVAAEARAYAGRRDQLRSALTVLGEQEQQRRLEIQEMEAQQRGLGASLALAEEQFLLSESLLADNLTPRMEHLQLERELEELRGTLAQLAAALPRTRAALAESVERVREVTLGFRGGASEEHGEVELELARHRELMARAAEQALRTTITTPIDGVVKNLRYNTVGGVVRPGEPIMEIVPSRGRLIIEARLDPRDVGHVEIGQKAVAKISTYDYVRYGGLDGVVTTIAADADTDDLGRHYFRVVIETNETSLGEDGTLPIIPGMLATVDIHTGDKSVLEYLVRPVLKLRHEAFRER